MKRWRFREKPGDLIESHWGELMLFADHEEIIKRQASAALAGMNAAKAISSNDAQRAARLRAESSPDALESERQANAKLTQELTLAEEGLANYAQENERLKQYEPLPGGKPLKVVLLEQKLKEIRDHSLTWAMVCDCDCPACNGMYEAIRDAEPQPREQS